MINFGVALPYVGARSAAELALAAEQAGWDGVFMGDAIWCEDPLIGLAAAAMVTSRIRLGTMVTPVPLRRPWKLASEALALERLSDGRLTLGLATGAVWMGWQAFPDEITDNRARAEMLDETIEILTLLFRREPFDYHGKHYHLELSKLDPQYYPPKPVQQPRIPLWCVGIWPVEKSMRRALKGDGVIIEKKSEKGIFSEVTPGDIAAITAYVGANRPEGSPFDIVFNADSKDSELVDLAERVMPLAEAGVTWWIEGMWELTEAAAVERIRRGPPVYPK